ncbi:MAG: hydantoinase/oxoprolinase family protein, partial [Deltaproteobacteria bacterium]|nr:hydantoinase/oxoprolinase family protein [Deltaproteobacteria bacterium]
RARADLAAAGFEGDGVRIERSLDMRYRYQVHELNVGMPEGAEPLSEQQLEGVYERFDGLYERTYGPGSGYREAGKEIMNFRLTATGMLDKPRLQRYPLSSGDAGGAVTGRRKVCFEEFEEARETPVYGFESLQPGNEIAGPAVIETPVTTILVNPGDRAVMDEYRNIRLLIGS